MNINMESLFNESSTHKALFEKVRTICLSFPGTSERLSHGAPTFFVNNKLSFVQYHVNHHGDGKIALWCSVPPEVQALFIETTPEIYFRPPYVGHLGWVGLRLDKHATWTDISGVIQEAYLKRAPKKYKDMIKQAE